MRLYRLLAVFLAAIGIGLVSGAVTQVAALDGSLKRAAAETSPPPRVTPQRVPVSQPPCRHRHLHRQITLSSQPT